MKETMKILLTEMINISGIKDSEQTYFRKALDKNRIDTITSTSLVVKWLDPVYFDYDSSKDFVFKEVGTQRRSDILYYKFRTLLKNCPEVKQLLILNREYLNFNPSLSSEEKEQIIQFVDDNTSSRVTSEYR